MKRRKGLVYKGVLTGAGLLISGVLISLGLLPKPASPQATPLFIFCAPSHVPAGESWVLLGSEEDIPLDLIAVPNAVGVVVLEIERLATRAVAVRLIAAGGAQGKLLRLSSITAGSEAYPDLYLGQAVPSLSADANFTEDDFTGGQLVVPGEYFMYGYLEGSDVPLAAVRIHNRAKGLWFVHEIAVEKARVAAEPALVVDDPAFVEVDPQVTLPDTDGDGIPDFDEEPEPKEPVPAFLGVSLEPGLNTLDLVAVDEAGNSSWRTIEVLTTFIPREEGI